MTDARILIIEPFYGGSHKVLIDLLINKILIKDFENNNIHLESLPAKKWHWRARTSALYFSQTIPEKHNFQILFCSSVLNLSDLIALRPDLQSTRKIIYFHENQLIYPVQKLQDRDFQYGYNQVISAIVAQHVIFNSNFNKESFLSSIKSFFKLQPDFRPSDLRSIIEPKCKVIYFPISLPISRGELSIENYEHLHIVWPHRWEHDKNPEAFFACLSMLKKEGYKFHLSVLGETFQEVPKIFENAKEEFSQEIINWGYLSSKNEYFRVLYSSDVAVSTSFHEFFGVSMMESVFCECYPLLPNRLVYPELFPKECLYNTDQQLFKRLKSFCRKKSLAKEKPNNLKFENYLLPQLKSQYENLFVS